MYYRYHNLTNYKNKLVNSSNYGEFKKVESTDFYNNLWLKTKPNYLPTSILIFLQNVHHRYQHINEHV